MILRAARIQRLWWIASHTLEELHQAAVRLADNISGCNRRHCKCCHISKAQPKHPSLRERRAEADANESENQCSSL